MNYEKYWEDYKGSINDDLERFLINLKNQKEVKDEDVFSFCTPKLTNEELKLVHDRNEEHFKTYFYHFEGVNPDVDVEEMKKSDSKSKFVHACCWRKTIPLTLETDNMNEINDFDGASDSDGNDDSAHDNLSSDLP